MRTAVGLTLLPLLFICPTAGEQQASLKDPYERQQWFRLREAILSTQNPPLFYRAVVAEAFHDDDEGEDMLQEVIRSMPGSWEASEALRVDGTYWLRSGHESNQSVAGPRACRIRYQVKRGCLYIPLTINGRKVEYLLDTGAGTSVVSESEARRLGLKLEPVQTQAFDAATGRNIRTLYWGIARRMLTSNALIRSARPQRNALRSTSVCRALPIRI